MKKALFLLVLLAAGAVLAHYHVQNQHYYPVTRLASSDGYAYAFPQVFREFQNFCIT